MYMAEHRETLGEVRLGQVMYIAPFESGNNVKVRVTSPVHDFLKRREKREGQTKSINHIIATCTRRASAGFVL